MPFKITLVRFNDTSHPDFDGIPESRLSCVVPARTPERAEEKAREALAELMSEDVSEYVLETADDLDD